MLFTSICLVSIFKILATVLGLAFSGFLWLLCLYLSIFLAGVDMRSVRHYMVPICFTIFCCLGFCNSLKELYLLTMRHHTIASLLWGHGVLHSKNLIMAILGMFVGILIKLSNSDPSFISRLDKGVALAEFMNDYHRSTQRPVTPYTLHTASLRGENCPICWENYSWGEGVIFLPCNHHFHCGCIAEALRQRNKCPYCNQPVKVEEKIRVVVRIF